LSWEIGAAGSGKIGISASRHAEWSSGEGRFYRRVFIGVFIRQNMALTRRAWDGTFTRTTELGFQEDGNVYRYDGCAKHVYIFGPNGVMPLTGRSLDGMRRTTVSDSTRTSRRASLRHLMRTVVSSYDRAKKAKHRDGG
jgi:hypothetical protein